MSLTIPHTKPRHKPLEVVIKVFDLNTNAEIRSHKINYNDKTRRVWLQKLSVWAWSNGHSVETYNIADKAKAEVDNVG